MTAPELAMNTQTATALISGGVAVFVALLGIGGAIVAQLVATRRAYSNSLAMFERQRTAELETRAQERAEAARREEVHRFADERRLTYAKYLRVSQELWGISLSGAEPGKEISDEYAEIHTQIDLLASEPVRVARNRIFEATRSRVWQDYLEAHNAFVDAARTELGTPLDSGTQRPADQDGNILD